MEDLIGTTCPKCGRKICGLQLTVSVHGKRVHFNCAPKAIRENVNTKVYHGIELVSFGEGLLKLEEPKECLELIP